MVRYQASYQQSERCVTFTLKAKNTGLQFLYLDQSHQVPTLGIINNNHNESEGNPL